MSLIPCSWCGAMAEKRSCDIRRSRWPIGPLYCTRACAGLARRDHEPPTLEQKKELKRLYDMDRREKLGDQIRAHKRAYYRANHERFLKEQAERRAQPGWQEQHNEYCRRPEYRAYKTEYDRRYRASKQFGEFSEAFLLLQDIEKAIAERATRYDIHITNGTLNKAQLRRRALWQQQSNLN